MDPDDGRLTPEQYEEVLWQIYERAANPGPDRDLALSDIMRLARLEVIEAGPEAP